MSCALTQDYTLDCADSFGGVKEVYLMEFENATAITVSAGVVTGITKATGKLFRKYALVAHTGEANEEYESTRANGTSKVMQSIKFPINKMTVAVRNELLLAGKNRLLFAVVDENGTPWLYGYGYGLTMTKASSKTGVALSDRNGYELEFTGEEKEFAYKIDSTTFGTLQTAGA